MDSLPPISAVIQTFNEENNIEACIRALGGADQILVVDMESTDSTVERAHALGAEVIVKERGHHRIVEAYRNFAIHAARYPWVLVVDADELVPPGLIPYLKEKIAQDPSPRAFLIPLKSYFMGRWMRCYYPEMVLRFFNRDGAEWPYRIHSRVNHKGPVEKIPARRHDLAFIHLANETVHRNIEKMNGYTDVEVERRSSSYRSVKLLYDPAFRFFKRYIIKGGILQGWPGFIRSCLEAVYRFTLLAKIEENRQQGHFTDMQKDIERVTKSSAEK